MASPTITDIWTDVKELDSANLASTRAASWEVE
eukprot:CAMPEP_0202362512 /NCGR_PEP_ID=MMETSP1126-20121109/14666_1 /ASSEMBLY_ACC=CAM_ASM_000457 /TAXON_ID=3047 /ORGANISM="Dunaliella tertiolecta, Strain CCMP1320" /LENGTH=32 /DNA_ID= /DNA_START= /DNA_END= /DNA_ORIENTATION=